MVRALPRTPKLVPGAAMKPPPQTVRGYASTAPLHRLLNKMPTLPCCPQSSSTLQRRRHRLNMKHHCHCHLRSVKALQAQHGPRTSLSCHSNPLLPKAQCSALAIQGRTAIPRECSCPSPNADQHPTPGPPVRDHLPSPVDHLSKLPAHTSAMIRRCVRDQRPHQRGHKGSCTVEFITRITSCCRDRS